MKSLVLRNKLLVYSIFIPIISLSQHCRIFEDSLPDHEFEYINIKPLNLKNESITLVSNSRDGIKYYSFIKDSLGYSFEYGDESKIIVSTRSEQVVFPNDLKKSNKALYIQSNFFSKEYFDVFIIKHDNTTLEIVPVASTIYNNIDCIKDHDINIFDCLDKFRISLNRQFKSLKKRNINISTPRL